MKYKSLFLLIQLILLGKEENRIYYNPTFLEGRF